MLSSLRKEKVFAYFEEISSIPRGSFHNEKIGEYLVNFAKEKGLTYSVDEAGNVLIRKPATKGYESSVPVIIQGHMDMVCVTEPDVVHDFLTEPLELYVEDGFLHAKGTTLGADNGIAIAMAMAILSEDKYEHPALEVVITTDEEVGMLGASALDMKEFQGRYMINVDSGEEGKLLTSCAGGLTAKVSFASELEEVEGTLVGLKVSGLKGGHSGEDINEFRMNANQIVARILSAVRKEIALVSINGGKADNVITSLCETKFFAKNRMTLQRCKREAALITREVSSWEPDLKISIDVKESKNGLAMRKRTENIIGFMNAVPSGVQVMSKEVPGLVESSLNMGVVKTSEDGILFRFSVRSQKAGYKEYLFRKISMIAEIFGGACSKKGEYPAWDYKKDSRLQKVMMEVYENMYQAKPEIKGVHAGLECGIFYEGIPDIDIVSIGADMFDIHSPKERLDIASAQRVFDYLTEVLRALK